MVDTKVTDRPKKKLDKKLLVACLSIAGVIILGLLIFFVIKVASDKPETGSPTDVSEGSQDDYEEASPGAEIPKEVAKLRPGDIEKIGKSQYVAEDVKYIDAGLAIMIEGQFYIGDTVELDDFKGTVLSIDLKTTEIMNSKGQVKIIANHNIDGLINCSKANLEKNIEKPNE